MAASIQHAYLLVPAPLPVVPLAVPPDEVPPVPAPAPAVPVVPLVPPVPEAASVPPRLHPPSIRIIATAESATRTLLEDVFIIHPFVWVKKLHSRESVLLYTAWLLDIDELRPAVFQGNQQFAQALLISIKTHWVPIPACLEFCFWPLFVDSRQMYQRG